MKRKLANHPFVKRLSASALPLRPTATGIYWLLAVLALLASAINYGNNLIFALAFLLLAVWLQAAWQCWRNLTGLHWQANPPAPAFAGGLLRIEGRLIERHNRQRSEIGLHRGSISGAAEQLAADGEATLALALPAGRRGSRRVDDLALGSTWPLGLWRSRCALPALDALIYPLASGDAALPAASPRPAHRQVASDDFQGLRAYAPGDSPRRINWRIFGRRDELVVNRFDGDPGGAALWLDWDHCRGHGEDRLSQLARWVLDAEHGGRDYGLRLPGNTLPSARGRAHCAQCLRQLSLFDPDALTGRTS